MRGFRDELIDVLVEHQRMDIGSCRCGWGVDTGQLGKSHAAHVADLALARFRAILGGPDAPGAEGP